MTFHLPAFVDESIDSSTDPLVIMLAREGSYDEAYQTACFHRAGQVQIVERSIIEQRPHEMLPESSKWDKRRKAQELDAAEKWLAVNYRSAHKVTKN